MTFLDEYHALELDPSGAGLRRRDAGRDEPDAIKALGNSGQEFWNPSMLCSNQIGSLAIERCEAFEITFGMTRRNSGNRHCGLCCSGAPPGEGLAWLTEAGESHPVGIFLGPFEPGLVAGTCCGPPGVLSGNQVVAICGVDAGAFDSCESSSGP